jgi:hypothetical protein
MSRSRGISVDLPGAEDTRQRATLTIFLADTRILAHVGTGANGNRDEVVMDATVVGRLETPLAPPRASDVRPTGARSDEVSDGPTAVESAPELTVEGRIGRGAVRGAPRR